MKERKALASSRSEALLRHCGQQARRGGREKMMRVVTTRSRCAGDLRFVPSFEHHGRRGNTFSFLLVPGSDLRPLLPCCSGRGAHLDEASPSKFPSSSFSSCSLSSLRGPGEGGVWGPRPCCHVVMLSCPCLATILTKPSLRVRTLLALLSGALVLGSVWRILRGPFWAPRCPIQTSQDAGGKHRAYVNWCLKQKRAGVFFSSGPHAGPFHQVSMSLGFFGRLRWEFKGARWVPPPRPQNPSTRFGEPHLD